MTTKELQALMEQIRAHLNTLAQLQIATEKLIHGEMAETGNQIKNLLVITQEHRRLGEGDGQ